MLPTFYYFLIYYGQGTTEAQLWNDVILTRIYFGYHDNVLAEVFKMLPDYDKPVTESEKAKAEEDKTKGEDKKSKIEKLYNYLSSHGSKMNYCEDKTAGYHIGSEAIESANKFISHLRLKRSGAWWYIKNANNMLKIRCAKYNGTYNKLIEKYKFNDRSKHITIK